MSKSDEMGWEYFGFPNPGFMPVWKPAEALMKALAERQLPFAGKWDFDSIAEHDQIEYFQYWYERPTLWSQNFCLYVDYQLKALAPRYLNHLQMSDLSAWSELSDMMWSWDQLLQEAADGEEDALADPLKGDLSPNWNLTWLRQRKKAIDLLLYAPVPHKYDYLTGSTHTGEPSSPAESVAAALSVLNPGIGTGLPASSVRLIYGPDHGWREGSYCCDIAVTRKIYAELPEGLDPETPVCLVLRAAGADGTDDSFAAAGPLSVGINVLTADRDGVFAEFDFRDLTEGIPAPTRDHTTSGGWRATFCSAFADYTKMFHFKGED